MSAQPHAKKSPPDAAPVPEGKPVPAGEKIPLRPSSESAATDQPVPAPKLTPEEQMALFEKELKENDWGHQPC